MTKLIDADRMLVEESEAYMNVQLRIKDETTKLINELVHKKIQMLLADAPEEDAVPVIRCKDCKYYVHRICEHDAGLRLILDDECFCSRAERKEADD